MQKNDGSSEPSFKFKQPFIKHWTKNKSLCPNVLWQSSTFDDNFLYKPLVESELFGSETYFMVIPEAQSVHILPSAYFTT